MLQGTPYELGEGQRAAAIAHDIEELQEEVEVLRSRGVLDQRTLGRLRSEWRVEQVYETTGIEGNQLDLHETRMVLARGITITGKPTRDADDARNMAEALDFLEALAGGTTPVTANDLRQIQSLVLGGGPGAGEYRRGDVRISGADHQPPPAAAVPRAVNELLAWLASTDGPPLLAAAAAHAWLAHIHPFLDGNGRTARALMNLLLIRAGYPIVLVRRADRPRYYEALAASDEADLEPLVALLVKRSRDSLRQIERVRAAETGLTEAVLRAQMRERDRIQVQFQTWRQATLLLLRSIEEAARSAGEASGGAIALRVQDYDEVTEDDFTALLARDASGNGWLASIRGKVHEREARFLLWAGFRSRDLSTLAHLDEAGASIFVSGEDHSGTHPFRQIRIGDTSKMPVREMAFDGSAYVTILVEDDGAPRAAKLGANELATKILTGIIEAS